MARDVFNSATYRAAVHARASVIKRYSGMPSREKIKKAVTRAIARVKNGTGARGTYFRNARSGKNKFGYSVQQGKTSYSATGATKRQAYGRLRAGMGQSGG